MFSQPYKCTLSPEMLKKAEAELHEDPKTRHLEIKTLRERLEKVPGYRGRTDDAFLLRFLRCKKFDQERAFSQVKAYYQVRKDYPEIFNTLTPKRMQSVLESGLFAVLDDRAPDGSRVVYMDAGKWDPDKCSMSDVLAANVLVFCKLIEEEETQVCGVTLIAELKEFGWHQAKHYTPTYARLEAAVYQEAMPIRFKAFHQLNEPTFFDVVFAIAKPFMKEKMLKRVHLHGAKLEKLHQLIPPDRLPQNLGGTKPPVCIQEWMNKLLACEEQFVEENKYGLVDMTIPGKEQKKADATQELGGTFRKLNVD